MVTTLLLLPLLLATVSADDPRLDRYKYLVENTPNQPSFVPEEYDVSYWRNDAQKTLFEKLQQKPIEGVAKNIILFIGDGMSIPTVTAARIYLGQLSNRSGENSRLSFEQFPYTGLSKTYCVNKQVADSACSSVAYLGGVKANYGTLGVTASVTRGNCSTSLDSRHHVDTILEWAQEAGKATGLVTTTRITHASPGGHYAHVADRDWESDWDVINNKNNVKLDPATCEDIASQLVKNTPGKNCKVLLGGGRSKFFPDKPMNPEWGAGERRDGANLIDEWKKEKQYRGKAEFVINREELLNVDIKHTDYLLGLFQPGHMKYHLEEGSEKQPSLEEMTETAIKLLEKEKRGYYLFVEGGKIDLAHHKNMARRALDETVEFHKAIMKAVSMVNEKETLLVVTADHAHTMSMAGYPVRGTDILGAEAVSENDHLNYPTLSYANGPSAEINRTGLRHNVANDDLNNVNYGYPSLVNLKDETHGGDDVAVFARGPWAHLLVGNYEQTHIPHVMAYAADIGPNRRSQQSPSTATSTRHAHTMVSAIGTTLAAILARYAVPGPQ